MNKDLVSVIVISYNNLEHYKESLDSIFIQDYENIELIFSDDGSVELPKGEIERYISECKGPNITAVKLNFNRTNMGTVKHANKAIKMSNGKYIKILAVGDLLYENKTISKLVSFMKERKSIKSVGYSKTYDENMEKETGPIPSSKEVDIIKKGSKEEIYKMISISGGSIPAPSRFYDREYFEKYGLYDEDYILLEDKPRIAMAVRSGCKIDFIDEAITKYRAGGLSSAGNLNPLLKIDRKKFLEKEVLPNIGFKLEKEDRRDLIVWGSSVKYLENKEALLDKGIKYFIDSNKNKAGEEQDGIVINLPEKLLTEKKEDIFIVICSSYYIEIEGYLEENGFREKENYININLLDLQ